MKKMKNMPRVVALLVVMCLVLPVFAGAVTAFEGVPDHYVKAKAAILLDMTSGEVLLEQDADAQMYPASLTKIMTCMLAIENGRLSDEITISPSAVSNMDPAGSSAGLLPGEVLTLEQLLYCVMISSANEACNVVAEYVSGSVENFVTLMNTRAKEIGCTATNFANPHGLHDENHYTTARDLSIIATWALQDKNFETICTTTQYTIPATPLAEERNLLTTNYLVSTATNGQYYYEEAKGVKTGFTTPAGRCLISTAEKGEMRLLSVVLGAETVVQESGDLILENFTETKALLAYGLENFTYDMVLSNLYPVAQVPVHNGDGPDAAVVKPAEDVGKILPKDYDAKDITTNVILENPAGVEAPVEEGQVLGSVEVTYQGQVLDRVDAVAIMDIPRATGAQQPEETATQPSGLGVVFVIILILLIMVGCVLLLLVLRRKKAMARSQKRMAAQGNEND